jgi:dTDP-4-dehydrorhamnose 3,5-epimerase
MQFAPTSIPDVITITPRVLTDERGSFMETWQGRKFLDAGIDVEFAQDNESFSQQWVLRGLHFQIQHAQGKLVRALTGEIFDVAVDLRRASPTFGRWVGETLSADNRRMLWVPAGFAHGFLVLSGSAQVAYKATDYYAPAHERCLRWDDPEVAIRWPLPPGVAPILGAKDRAAPGLRDVEVFP